MNTSFLCTFIGPDKPGLVERLANTVNGHHGNWLDSSMTQLGGQFAGIVRIAVASDNEAALKAALTQLEGQELRIRIVAADDTSNTTTTQLQRLRVVGNDRPGIVKEVAQALAQRHINVVTMETHLSSAPMSADQLFHADIELALPASQSDNELEQSLDQIAEALSIEIDLMAADET